jgi:uncharacterized alpha-E superfamily protein
VLSRIAESLFWVGRYVERAEDTARLLDVYIHNLLEDPGVEERDQCAKLLAIMGAAPTEPVTTATELTELLAYDTVHPASIVATLNAAREGARGAREAISSEMWECLNATYNAIPTEIRLGRSLGPHSFFAFVKDRAAIMHGLTDTTMSRDDGWRFLVLGRSLERVDMTARMLADRYGARGPDEWVTTLRACSAHEAFLRTYRRAVDEALVAEFLLLDRLFPRSVFHALATAEQCLGELDPSSARAGVDDEGRRIVGKARADLEFRRVDDLLRDLPDYLTVLQERCAAASDAVADRYFRFNTSVPWRHDGALTV